MKQYKFKVVNAQEVTITVNAKNEDEAREKLENFDIVEEFWEQDDYYFDEADLISEEELEEDTTLEEMYE